MIDGWGRHVGLPDLVGPRVGADRDVMAATAGGGVDQEATDAAKLERYTSGNASVETSIFSHTAAIEPP